MLAFCKMKPIPLEKRFWSKVDKTNTCWHWTGAKHGKKGPGVILMPGGKIPILAHKLSWTLANGFLSDNLWVIQTCGNRLCVNPDHLRISETKTQSIEDRFWRYAVKQDGCWEWRGRKDKNGYGMLSSKKRPYTLRAPRISWELHIGPIPNGLWVLHKCDNPSCSNPEHLFLGTPLDNVTDMIQKGRGARKGEQNSRAVLTDEQVAEVRSLYRLGDISQQTIADMFGVSQSSISQMVLYQTRV